MQKMLTLGWNKQVSVVQKYPYRNAAQVSAV